MAFPSAIPTSANQVQAFAGALYGVQIGTVTMAQVTSDIQAAGGLDKALNNYYTASFGSMTTASVAAKFAGNLGLTGAALSEGTNYVTARLNAAPANERGAVIADILNLFAGSASDPTYGAAATAWNAKVDVASAYTGANNVAIGSTVSQGTVFALTTGVDVVSGTAGNDTINAATATLSALDNVDGGAGTDTLNVSDVGSTGPGAFAMVTSAVVKNVEVLTVTTASDDVLDGVTANVSAWTGLQTVTVNIQGTDAPVTMVTTKGNVTTATIVGATTSAIADSATTDALTSVTVVDSTGLATLTSDALNTVTLKSSTGGATVIAAAATRALTVNLDGVTAGTVTDVEATSLTVNATGTKSSGVTLAAAKATDVTVNAAVAATIADVTIAAAKSLTVTGAGATTVSATTTVTALTSIDASGSTGGLTVTPAIGPGVAFTGSSAADSVKIGATTKAIATGAGNDTVTLDAVAALGTAGTVDAGEGTDTLVFNTYANAVTASGATTFAPTVSGFEKLELSGVNSAAAAAVNLANLDNINYVTLSATNTKTTTISNMAANGTIAFTASQTTAEPVTVSLKDATGTADVLNVVLSKATATASVGLTAAGVETVNVTSTETATTLLGTVTHGVEALVVADATALNISGNAGVTITTLTGTKLASIDASGVTTGLVSFTTDALTTAATIKGSATGTNSVNFSAAVNGAVTYTGGTGNDSVTASNGKNNVITLGDGTNSVTGAAGNNTITGGTGADTVGLTTGNNVVNLGNGANAFTATTGNNTYVGGTGVDTISVGAGVNNITTGAGADVVTITTPGANGNVYTTITDIAAGDSINLADLTAVPSANGALGSKITLADTAAFADYLAASTATIIADGGASTIKWFQFVGNTYIVVDDTKAINTPDDTNFFENGIDSVVKLTGLVDLALSTTVADVLTIV